ncbi:Fur family transcriptional regulator [Nocardioides insulae]|uniref:Fur family transcriptional regulator n=1 Tax=Nocardioides insulae TaxID=394734 RepID=UPI0004024D71|nr:transcriptional repressor [Nocardioides insulae]
MAAPEQGVEPGTDPEGDWRERLRRSGRRLTPQRELILRAVQTLGHATPDEVLTEVHTQSTSINISTVYRTLEVLEEFGLVRHAHLSDRAPTFHSVGEHEHFHLVCRNCSRVISVDVQRAESFVAVLGDDFDFEPDLGHLTVFGRCRSCPDPEHVEET